MNKFLLLFIAVPLIEMVVLIKVGQQIGALSTIALVILTAVIGIALLKQQGIAMLNRANWKMNQGQIPAREMAEGIVLAVGGALLLTPGFVTDAFGFICILPGSRHFLLNLVLKNISINPIHHSNGSQQWQEPQQGHRESVHRHTQQQSQKDSGDVIEGEYEEKK
ncbi:MAG: FxsA family protein [Oceanospirillum sp.]|nr:FxsA family protein [Oceanospirillum sp.]MDX1397539.1 FxsA family protein [Oceanospirillum sp.]